MSDYETHSERHHEESYDNNDESNYSNQERSHNNQDSSAHTIEATHDESRDVTNSRNDESHHHHHASAPTHDDNGYIVVQDGAASATPPVGVHNDDISRMLIDLDASNAEAIQSRNINQAGNLLGKVIAEADSSSAVNTTFASLPSSLHFAQTDLPQQTPLKPATATSPSATSSSSKSASASSGNCAVCPYYKLAMRFMRTIQVPPKVEQILLWRDPKKTGAIFGTLFVLLLSIANFSLLTVTGSIMLIAMSAIGAYRFYLAVMFRIKGTTDETFENLSKMDLSLPHDKVQEFSRLIESDINRMLQNTKRVLLWEDFTNSIFVFATFYAVYTIGCVFNTMTLLILALVSAFTLPKVYQVYQKPIDHFLETATGKIHLVVKQVMAKMPPFLKKKKNE